MSAKDKVEASSKVHDLIGPIFPMGDPCYDNKVVKNIETMIFIADDLIDNIMQIATEKDSCHSSRARAGEKAHGYMKALVEDLIEELKEANNE